MKPRKPSCSFCCKSPTEVGPLVEGPGEAYICGECVELCQAIIEQERRRRNPPPAVGPAAVQELLDKVVTGEAAAKQALVRAASLQHERRGRILLIGPSRSARRFLARALAHALGVPFAEIPNHSASGPQTRALAHALGVPFAAGDSGGFVKAEYGPEATPLLLFSLLEAGDFDVQAAQRGVVYVDGVERAEAQEALVHLWQGPVVELVRGMQLAVRGILFICGGVFSGLHEGIVRSGRHPEQPITAEALVAGGARSEWVRLLAAVASVGSLDEETLTRMVAWVDFSRADTQSAAPHSH